MRIHLVGLVALSAPALGFVSPVGCASKTRVGKVQADYLTTLNPVDQDLVEAVQPTGSALTSRTTSLARRGAVEALSAALSRSIDRSNEASGLLGEELETVAAMLDREVADEASRLRDLREIVSKLEAVVAGKAELVQKETVLLTKIQELKSQTVEAVIVRRLDQAAVAKAELISIEMVLSETMVASRAQLEAELPASEGRLSRMEAARAGLPAAGDLAAVRAYGFSAIVELQDFILQSQRATAASEEQVARLRKKIASAMEERNLLLGLQSQAKLDEEAALAEAARVARAEKAAAAQRRAGEAATQQAVARAQAAATPPPGGRPRSRKNEVELAQTGALRAGSALVGVGRALFKTVAGEEGVGDTLRAAAGDVKAAAEAFGSSGRILLDKK